MASTEFYVRSVKKKKKEERKNLKKEEKKKETRKKWSKVKIDKIIGLFMSSSENKYCQIWSNCQKIFALITLPCQFVLGNTFPKLISFKSIFQNLKFDQKTKKNVK